MLQTPIHCPSLSVSSFPLDFDPDGEQLPAAPGPTVRPPEALGVDGRQQNVL